MLKTTSFACMKKGFLLLCLFFSVCAVWAQTQREITLKLPFHEKEGTYLCEELDGGYLLEGDILINPDALNLPDEPTLQRAVVINRNESRWKGGILPYTIEAGHPRTADIITSIEYVNSKTNVKLIPRTNEQDYAIFTFKYPNSCHANIGKIGGAQYINIGTNCALMSITHEICHTLGFYHEQSRNDRDQYVEILWENIEKDKQGNFQKDEQRATDVGEYDYGSIMHYSAYAFSKNQKETIRPRISGFRIGQREGFSPNDIKAINQIYPKKAIVTPPNPTPAKSVDIVVTNELHAEETEGQWYEAVWVTINEKTYQFKMDFRSNPSEQVEIALPTAGAYNYSLYVQTYWYTRENGRTNYQTKPQVGKGTGKINVQKGAKFRLYIADKVNPDGTAYMYLQADR
ncbi:MAG: hypothetical protein EAZ95_06520 [Bacteroidetes bacterium]|nr:MAG: hypothetical protein EAZ95_06520 [Bacteroidota bacterium]